MGRDNTVNTSSEVCDVMNAIYNNRCVPPMVTLPVNRHSIFRNNRLSSAQYKFCVITFYFETFHALQTCPRMRICIPSAVTKSD